MDYESDGAEEKFIYVVNQNPFCFCGKICFPMKFVQLSLYIVISLLYGCKAFSWERFSPECKNNPAILGQIHVKSLDDYLPQFDIILQDTARWYFMHTDTAVAVAEISEELERLFISYWHLDGLAQEGECPRRYATAESKKIITMFNDNGVKDPKAMIRVLFSAYHKWINRLPYSWKYEIQKINAYWIDPPIIKQCGYASPQMRKRENNLLNRYYFQKICVGDTTVCMLTGPPKLKWPSWYYLTGIVLKTDTVDNSLDVKLVAFQSDRATNKVYWQGRDYSIGDTIHGDTQTWRMTKRYNYSWNYFYPSQMKMN